MAHSKTALRLLSSLMELVPGSRPALPSPSAIRPGSAAAPFPDSPLTLLSKGTRDNPYPELPPDGKFGRGWWYNQENERLLPMDPKDLGPHGDHDGWIAIGDNAHKLGIDQEKAMSLQRGTYGMLLDETPNPDEWKRLLEDTGQPDADPRSYISPDDFYEGDGRELFERTYGSSPMSYPDSTFDDLIRMRHYDKQSHSDMVMDSPYSKNPGLLDQIQEALSRISFDRPPMVSLETPDNYWNLPYEEVMSARSFRDLGPRTRY